MIYLLIRQDVLTDICLLMQMHNQMAFSMSLVYKYMGDMLEMFLIKKNDHNEKEDSGNNWNNWQRPKIIENKIKEQEMR